MRIYFVKPIDSSGLCGSETLSAAMKMAETLFGSDAPFLTGVVDVDLGFINGIPAEQVQSILAHEQGSFH